MGETLPKQSARSGRSMTPLLLRLLAVVVIIAPVAAAEIELPDVPLTEQERSFLEDGPGFLLDAAARERYLDAGHPARQEIMSGLLDRDPLPATPANELAQGIERRRRLLESRFISPRDVRGRLLFLHGAPDRRQTIDCRAVYRPLEIWSWGAGEGGREAVLYRPAPTLPFRLWVPWEGKAALYTREMEYYLQQWEELRSQMAVPQRFDRQLCEEADRVDEVTGISGLSRARHDAPDPRRLRTLLDPPGDLAAWAREAARTPLPETPPALPVEDVRVLFPAREGQRMIARIRVTLPPDPPLKLWTAEGKPPEMRLAADAILEQGDDVFEEFRVRFHLEPPAAGEPIALVLQRQLRPDRDFVLRLRLVDEVGSATAHLVRSFHVPQRANPADRREVLENAVVAMGEELAMQRLPGADSLRLVPPAPDEVMIGYWRAEAIVSGGRITEVVFLVDGQRQMTRKRPPFTAELRLSEFPKLQTVTAQGYDAAGELVDEDEVVLNQPRGSFQVRIVQPARGAPAVLEAGQLKIRAEIVVPEDRRIETVEFRVNDELRASLESPPWETAVGLSSPGEMAYLAVVAHLDDGSRQEDLRILNAPGFVEELDVRLVELYATVTDRWGGLVTGLPRQAFHVFEDGREQKLQRFEEVENLPLHLGVIVDTSGSMASSLAEAERAANGFLDAILTPKDTAFAVTFSDHVELVMPPTDDAEALRGALTELRPVGWTRLYDAVVTGLYYFRGIRGRRALVVLTDGEDTSSRYDFDATLEFARRSGVTIYTIGLAGGQQGVDRRKLAALAAETGGRTFVISNADELQAVYGEIERELRSQYLLAYSPPAGGEPGTFQEVRVEVDGAGRRVRTVSGYYR